MDKHVIQSSINHAKANYPGAPVESLQRELDKLDPETTEHLTRFNADKKYLTFSDASIKRKTTVTRDKDVADLFKLYTEDAKAEKIQNPVNRTYFYDNQPPGVSDPHDEQECMCDTCHHCGNESWRHLHILNDVVEATCGEVQAALNVVHNAS